QLATRHTDSQQAEPDDVGTLQANRRSLAPQGPDPATVPERALRRYAPEVGALCGNSARRDLRGGPPARAVPTATIQGDEPRGRSASVLDFFPKSVREIRRRQEPGMTHARTVG